MAQASTGNDRGDSPVAGTAVESRPPERRIHLRLIFLAVGLFSAFLAAVGLVLYFKPGGDAEPSREPSLKIFSAGPADEFAPASITYFQHEHFYLVRFGDGAFLALYDLAPLSQATAQAGDMPKTSCRIKMQDDDEMAGWLGSEQAARGFPSTGFVDACSGIAWDAGGRYVAGPASGDLDRFPTATIDDIVRVDLGERRCVNAISPESPCIPTR